MYGNRFGARRPSSDGDFDAQDPFLDDQLSDFDPAEAERPGSDVELGLHNHPAMTNAHGSSLPGTPLSGAVLSPRFGAAPNI